MIKTGGRERIFKLAFVLSLLAALPACLSNNNIGSTGRSTASSSSSGSGLDSSATDDGAKQPCTIFDTSSPKRAICISCYQSILSTRCPGKSDFSACVDKSVQTSYISLVNTCTAQTAAAGFICSQTCSAGLVINPTTCTCVAPTSSSGGTQLVDVGQRNFGPPIAVAEFPSGGITADVASGTCSATFDLYLGVQNRGDSVFGLNSYLIPEQVDANTLNAAGDQYFSNLQTPVMATTSQVATHPGTNVVSTITFTTGGSDEVIGAAGNGAGSTDGVTDLRVSVINAVSGHGGTGASFGGDGGDAADASWTWPGYGARDGLGNVYFSDPVSHVVRVICYIPDTGATHPFCPAGTTAGTIKIVAGTAGTAGWGNGTSDGNTATASFLSSPHGIAVDHQNNVYIADTGNHVIRIVCGTVTSGVCNGRALRDIITACGVAHSPGYDNIWHGTLNFPMGVDVADGGAAGAVVTRLLVADYQNHAIRTCDLDASDYTDGEDTGTLATLIGTGIAGHLIDGFGGNITGMRYPTDVKINRYGNIFYADSRNHQVRVLCVDNGNEDFCKYAPVNRVYTLAGKKPDASNNPVFGTSGDGTLSFNVATSTAKNTAALTVPTQLLIAKRYANDIDARASVAPFINFSDQNVFFTEKLFAPNSTQGVSVPVAMPGFSGVNSMSMGLYHTCVLSAGVVKCVGDNTSKQIGNTQASNPQSTPTTYAASGVSGMTVIGSGDRHTCATNSAGTSMKCWGFNGTNGIGGQLGDGTITTPDTPVAVDYTTAVGAAFDKVAGGDLHTCAIDKTNDRAYCWGNNTQGQLGTNDMFAYNRPTIVSNTTATDELQDLAAGALFTCYSKRDVANDNYVECWGANDMGQLSDGSSSNRDEAGTLVDLPNTTALTFNSNADYFRLTAAGAHACAWRGTGLIWCWGDNTSGQVGNGLTGDPVRGATQIVGLTTVQFAAAGTSHTCAVTSLGTASASGTIKCWGDNTYNQLGNDDVPMSAAPIDVLGVPVGVISGIYAGGDQTCAVIGAAKVPYCWGSRKHYAIGNGTVPGGASGNALRGICYGDTTTGSLYPPVGLCKGYGAGTIYTFAGSGGYAGSGDSGDGGNARSAYFAKLIGATYDAYKNIIVTSSGFTDRAGNTYADYSLRRIYSAAIGKKQGLKYTITDSNDLTSYWCLKLKPLTACDSDGSCACAMIKPTDDQDNPNFWYATTQNVDCF